MLFKLIQPHFIVNQEVINFDAVLTYLVLIGVLLAICFIFKVWLHTQKIKIQHILDMAEINKQYKVLKTQHNGNQVSNNDFNIKQEELFSKIERLKTHWLGLNLIIKSRKI